MLRILFFIFLKATNALKLANTTDSILLLPNSESKVVPFVLEAESEEENVHVYSVDVVCSASVKSGVVFGGGKGDFCGGSAYTGTPAEVNAMIGSVTAKLSGNEPKLSDLRVDYAVESADGHKTLLEHSQKLDVATFLPIQRVNRSIHYQPNNVTYFKLLVLQIPERYYANAKEHDFELAVSSNPFPEWLTYRFINNELYFMGTAPKDLDSSYSYIFTIVDKQSGLRSESINIDVSNAIEAQTSSDKAVIIIVFLIFTGIIACILLIILISSRKPSKSTAYATPTYSCDDKQPADRTTTHVLSDSIIHWNKQIIARHKTKNFDAHDDETNNSSPMRVPGFAYEKFDETFELSEENRSPMKMSGKLSEIYADEDEEEGKKGNCDRSSFLDEIRFKFN